MKVSPAFKIVVRLIGVAGICVGSFFVLIAFLIFMTKAHHLDFELSVAGTALILFSAYLACGVPHFLAATPAQKTLHSITKGNHY